MNIKSADIVEYEQSQTLQIIKQDFVNGVWPSGCERCKIEEDNGIQSKRQLDGIRWQSRYQDYNIDRGGYLTASLAFGNTCNLSCVTCNAFASSRWFKEHQKIYAQSVPPNHFYKQDFVEQMIALAPQLVHIDIPGGEPFVSGVAQQQQLLIHLINNDQAGDISLHYTTNATIWPDGPWWDLWSHFREVDIQLSVDAIGIQFEYIRYPAVWSDVLTNIDRYQDRSRSLSNIRLSLSHTVSAYNIYYLPEFITWCQQEGLPMPWCGRVHTPVHMRPSVWPEPARKYIIAKLMQHPSTEMSGWINVMQSDDSQHFAKFQQVTAALDHNRGQDFCTAFPELAEWYRT